MDFALERLDDGHFDIALDANDVKKELGLNSGVFLSIFSQGRAEGRGGYWGDFLAEINQDQLGSIVWSFLNKPNTVANRQEIVAAIEASLSWMLEDSVASNVSVELTNVLKGSVEFTIEIERLEDEAVSAFTFLWDVHKSRLTHGTA